MKMLLKLPTPSSISFFWNFGSLLGVMLTLQVLTGLFLSMHYSSDLSNSFNSVIHLNFDVNYGFFVRYFHANGATFFFLCIYLHIARGLFYKSYTKTIMTWISGVSIYLLFMGVAFLGYVLPWGQMSYWGATVITNLVSAIPYLGVSLLEWIWGGFSVSGPTLSRFYSMHFIFPLFGILLVLIHLMFLHDTGSSNPLGLMKNSDKIEFHPLFTIKDLLGFVVCLFMLTYVVLHKPLMFMDPDNFLEANPLVTPPHIQPEWYFLFAYAILRSIPNKLGGVLGLLSSIMILYILGFNSKRTNTSLIYQLFCMLQYSLFSILTFLGMMTVEFPYTIIGELCSCFYFINMVVLMLL